MSDFDTGAAPAASESISAPVAQGNEENTAVATPNPISTEGKPGSEPEPAKPVSTREALEKAASKVKADADAQKAKEPGGDKKPIDTKAVKAETATDDKSKPTPKPVNSQPETKEPAAEPNTEAQPSKFTAPERFSPDAKTAWETAPEPVKAEVHRAIRELEQGHQKYRVDAEAFNEIREYDTLAKQHGTSVKDALTRYTGLERRLSSEDTNTKAQAIAEVLQYAGVNPRQYAAFITGQKPDQVQAQSDAVISSLQREIADLKSQVGGVTSTIKSQHTNSVLSDISKFAEANPRFDELGETIARLISTGMAEGIADAYQMAERLNPVMPETKPQVAASKDDLQAQTLKGSKSVSGAPSAGSNPASTGKPSSSIREALKRAQAAAG